MRERSIFFYIISLAGVALGFAQNNGAIFETETTRAIIVVLAAVVLISIALLLNMVKRLMASRIVAVCAFAVTVWLTGASALPLAAATAIAVPGTLKPDVKITGIISVAVCFVFALIFRPDMFAIIVTTLLLGFSLYVLRLYERHQKIEQTAENSDSRAEEMRELLGSQRRMLKSAEQVSRLE